LFFFWLFGGFFFGLGVLGGWGGVLWFFWGGGGGLGFLGGVFFFFVGLGVLGLGFWGGCWDVLLSAS